MEDYVHKSTTYLLTCLICLVFWLISQLGSQPPPHLSTLSLYMSWSVIESVTALRVCGLCGTGDSSIRGFRKSSSFFSEGLHAAICYVPDIISWEAVEQSGTRVGKTFCLFCLQWVVCCGNSFSGPSPA